MPPKTYGRQKSSETISSSTLSSSSSKSKSSVTVGGKKMSSLSSVSFPKPDTELMRSYNQHSNSPFLHLSDPRSPPLHRDLQVQAQAHRGLTSKRGRGIGK
jgi:hypothetical protein